MTRSRPWRLASLTLFVAVSAAGWAGGAGAGEEFVVGSGRARASLFEIVPRTGGLTLPVNFGRAVASYQGAVARAGSLALKPPEEPPAAPAEECGSRRPAAGSPGSRAGGGRPSSSFPFAHNIEVSSDQKDADRGREETFLAAPPGGPVQAELQHQVVAAHRDPRAEASTTSGRIALPGLAELVGGRAEARSGVLDGTARLAGAVVVMELVSLFDGAVVLEDLRWEATQRTGEGETLDGRFSVGRISVAGTPLAAPPDQAGTGDGADPFSALNEALAPTGLAVETPRVEKDGGVARVTPMTVRVADSAVGRQVLGPALGRLQPVRDPVVDGLLGFSCDFGLAVTVADVALGIASGSGGVSFDFGGVSATTEGVRYENPFGGPLDDLFPGLEAPPSEDPVAAFVPGAPEAAADVSRGLYDPPVDRGFAEAPVPSGSGEQVEALVAAPSRPAALRAGPTSGHIPGRRGGTALAVGLIGLAATLAVALADALHLRRAARTIP